MRISAHLFSILFLALFSVNANGQAAWKWGKSAGGPGQSEGYYCLTDGHGNVYGSGENYNVCYFGSDSIVQAGVYLVKYDTNGNYKWVRNARTYTTNNPKWLGMCLDSFGNEYIFGSYMMEVATTHDTLYNVTTPVTNYFLMKADSLGNIKWLQRVGDVVTATSSPGNCLASDAKGNLYITCSFSDTARLGSVTLVDTGGLYPDILVAKLDSSGAPIWAKSFGGGGTDMSTGISVSPANSVYITGNFGSSSISFGSVSLTDTGSAHGYTSTYLAKLDSNGNVVWARNVAAGNATINDVAVNSMDELFVTGTYHNSALVIDSITLPFAPVSGYFYGFIAKFTNSGAPSWARLMQGNQVQPWMPVFDACENVWVSSGFGTGVCTDVIDGHTLTSPAGSHDPAVVSGWTDGGNYIYSTVLASGGDDRSGLAADCNGNLYLIGDYMYSTLVFGTDTMSTTTGEFQFLSKYQTGTGCVCTTDSGPGHTGIQELNEEIDISVYPNPAQEYFTVSCTGVMPADATMRLSDVTGRTVRTVVLNGNETIVSTASLRPGMYICNINIGGRQTSRKLVIMR